MSAHAPAADQPQPHIDAAPPAGPPPRVTHTRTWAVTWRGVWTVAALELRQRVRSTRWIVALAIFAVVVGIVTALTWYARTAIGDGGEEIGRAMFGFIVFFVLFLGMLVSPTLSATSINGDRQSGTLATLQVTLLSPAEIVLGKLLAAWVSSLAFLAVSVPFVIWAFAAGGTAPVALLTTLLLLALVLAVVCAVGLGFSALSARTAGSAVLTYVTVAGMTIVSLIVFGLTLPLVSGEERVQVYGQPEYLGSVEYDERGRMVDRQGRVLDEEPCRTYETTRWVTRTERTWWLLAVNPFVVVADAVTPASGVDTMSDPMSLIRYGVRSARLGAEEPLNECWGSSYDWEAEQQRQLDRTNALGAVWPWGLAFQLLLGAGAVVVAVRRLTIPQGRLPRGVRIA